MTEEREVQHVGACEHYKCGCTTIYPEEPPGGNWIYYGTCTTCGKINSYPKSIAHIETAGELMRDCMYTVNDSGPLPSKYKQEEKEEEAGREDMAS